jgi:hypothetical protein
MAQARDDSCGKTAFALTASGAPPGSGKGINIDRAKVLRPQVLSEDRRIGREILPNEFELLLSPRAPKLVPDRHHYPRTFVLCASYIQQAGMSRLLD